METTLVCDRGCKHTERWCATAIEHERCSACMDSDGEPTCNVARFVEDNAADCSRRFMRHSCGHLTGFTRRAFAALVHLADAAQVADNTNRPAVMNAISSLVMARSVREDFAFTKAMIDDDKIADEALLFLRIVEPGRYR